MAEKFWDGLVTQQELTSKCYEDFHLISPPHFSVPAFPYLVRILEGHPAVLHGEISIPIGDMLFSYQ